MENKTDVKGGPILDTLVQLLFKGLNNIFDSAAEYENDMGVLKQVTKLKVTRNGKEYEVAIKLAPIKDRENMFYVEIDDGGCPGLDFSAYNKKPMKIDKKNSKEFEELIINIMRKAGVEMTTKEDSPKGKRKVIECYDTNDYMRWEENEQKGPEPEIIDVIEYTAPSEEEGKVTISLECDDRQLKPSDDRLLEDVLTDVDPSQVDSIILDILKTSKLITVSSAKEDTEEMLQDNEVESSTRTANYVDVSLSYIKSADEINLSSIYASNVTRAMDIVQNVIDDDDFVALLTEDPQCFRITDEGEAYDIAAIDEVDVSNVRSDIYNAICSLSDLIDAYSVNLDIQEQSAIHELLSALQKTQVIFQPQDKLGD